LTANSGLDATSPDIGLMLTNLPLKYTHFPVFSEPELTSLVNCVTERFAQSDERPPVGFDPNCSSQTKPAGSFDPPKWRSADLILKTQPPASG
jgi:hypothetical protein